MPLFGNRFSPKKAPLRRKGEGASRESLEELVSAQRTVHLKLGDQEFLFENGDWTTESGANSTTHKSNKTLKKKVQELQEENNLLRLKYEMIINMLTQATAENHIKEREKLTKGGRSKSKI